VGSIVVGVGGAEHGRRALRWAQQKAARHGDELTALLAWGLFDQLHADGSASFDPDYGPTDAAAALDAMVADTLGADAAGAVRQVVVSDLPARALLDAAREANLLVLGPRGRGELRELVLGSVTQACLHHAPCPVAVVRGNDEPAAARAGTAERIVAGVDGSETSDRALRWALDDALARRGIVAAVHAWHVPFSMSLTAGTRELSVFEDAAGNLLDQVVDATAAEYRDVPVERVLVRASPADALLGAARDAALVVVGGRGVGGFRGLLLGSVSQHLAHHAPCPVVVVRGTTRPAARR
jgi:nucleotide-binding universal stress UspA family protein